MSTKKISRPCAGDKGKSASIREIAGKVADIVRKPFSKGKALSKRKPFGGKGGRKRKPTEDELRQAEAKAKPDELEKDDACPTEAEQSRSSISSAFNSFFYTDEKFIDQFEDREILEYVRMAHPEYNPKAGDDSALRKAILSILSDSRFMSRLLDRYGMTIFDFFKFLFRIEPSVFKGTFITKV